MDKHILLLANSWKMGGRCLAGIEVEFTDEIPSFKFDEGKNPIWIRPVSGINHGEICHSQADPLRIMDVVRVEGVEHAPEGYQTENYRFKRLTSLGGDFFETDDLGWVTLPSSKPTFGNRKNAVHDSCIHRVDHSLVIVEPQEFHSYNKISAEGRAQPRGKYRLGDDDLKA